MARAWLAWWMLLAALYLLLADTTAVPELVTGAVAVRRHRIALSRRPGWRDLAHHRCSHARPGDYAAWTVAGAAALATLLQ
jgi:hypothetical protein